MSKINDNFGLKNGGYSNSENTIDLARHRWYYYKEGFSPFLVEQAIEHAEVNKNDIVLDPFNGGGTTTLTCSLNGIKSVGIEVNPFTSFLSNAKAQGNIDLREFENLEERILQTSRKKRSKLIGFSTFSKKESLDKWLFNDSVLNAFEAKWGLVEKSESEALKNVFKLALISSAIQNCNAKRDGKCFRYRPNWESNNFDSDSFLNSLQIDLEKIKLDIQNTDVSHSPLIFNNDSRKLLTAKDNNIDEFKLCITSPPYLNTFDYTDIYRPELFLGKFVKNQEELYNLRLNTVRSHIQAKWDKPTTSDFGSLYVKSIEHVRNNMDLIMDRNIPTMIQAYFEDMHKILTALKAKAKKDAQLWFVVSNSAYADMEIPVDLIIGDIGAKAGWYLKEIGVLRYIGKRKTKHSPNIKELRESVIIFSNKK